MFRANGIGDGRQFIADVRRRRRRRCSPAKRRIKDYNLTPLARFVGFAVAGVPPEIMGIGPKEAIPSALKQPGITQDDLDWIELNEAFAAQALAVMQDIGLDPDEGQSARRRDRARSSARRDRRDAHRDARARPAPPQAEVRHGDDVHRHRHGRGGNFRGGLIRRFDERCGPSPRTRNPILSYPSGRPIRLRRDDERERHFATAAASLRSRPTCAQPRLMPDPRRLWIRPRIGDRPSAAVDDGELDTGTLPSRYVSRSSTSA